MHMRAFRAASPRTLPHTPVLQLAWVFGAPVDVSRYTDYLSYVSTPMDFGSMAAKIAEGRYAEPAEVRGGRVCWLVCVCLCVLGGRGCGG
jgi:hypothetical protein